MLRRSGWLIGRQECCVVGGRWEDAESIVPFGVQWAKQPLPPPGVGLTTLTFVTGSDSASQR